MVQWFNGSMVQWFNGSMVYVTPKVNVKCRAQPAQSLLAVANGGRMLSELRRDLVFFKRNTTVQVWTIGEGFGIGSEFRQTCCAANNFRDHDLNSVKAILAHCTHRLLSESTRFLCTLRNGFGGRQSRRLHQIAK